MQIIFVPNWVMILSFFIVWPLLQLIVTLIFNFLNPSLFNPNFFILKEYKWEKKGQIYKTVFKINKWKHLLPDGAKVHKNGFRKKNIKTFDDEYLNKFIIETGRAELSHWCQIIPFWIFGFWCPFFVIWIMLLYALLVNFPCILAQRYNRPRLVRILENNNKRIKQLY